VSAHSGRRRLGSGSSGSRSVSKSKSPAPGQTDKATDKKNKDDDDDDDDDKSSDEEEEKKEAGCKPDLPCRNGATPLLLLMRHSQVYPAEEKLPLAELLIARGADVNVISTDKMTPLLWAVLNVQGPLVKLLMSHGMLCRLTLFYFCKL
jgi:ankyrin repeat protein